MKSLFKYSLLVVIAPLMAQAQVTTDDMNKSNNPLTPMFGLNLHDYMTSSIFGTDEDSNTFFLRAAMPHKLAGLPQIARLSVPYQSVPDIDGNKVNGMGDINLFDIFLLPPQGGVQFGVGPYFVFPTAAKDETGSGKWQLGVSGTAMAPQPWGLLGALLTYQHDVGGDADRSTQNILTFQPFVIYNLPHSFYLRSVGIWYFDWQTGDYYIPVGFGVGKVWKQKNGVVWNLFAEPQWTMAHEGEGVPNYQTFVGLNLQFPLGEK